MGTGPSLSIKKGNSDANNQEESGSIYDLPAASFHMK